MYHSNGAPHPSSFFRGWGGCWESETWYYSSEHSVTLCFYPWPEIIQDFAGVNSHHCNPRLEQNSSTCITQVPLAPDHVSPLLGVSLLLTVEVDGSLHFVVLVVLPLWPLTLLWYPSLIAHILAGNILSHVSQPTVGIFSGKSQLNVGLDV